MNMNELQLKKQELNKKKEIIVRSETKLEGLLKEKEKNLEKLKEFGTTEELLKSDIEKLDNEITLLIEEYKTLDEQISLSE